MYTERSSRWRNYLLGMSSKLNWGFPIVTSHFQTPNDIACSKHCGVHVCKVNIIQIKHFLTYHLHTFTFNCIDIMRICSPKSTKGNIGQIFSTHIVLTFWHSKLLQQTNQKKIEFISSSIWRHTTNSYGIQYLRKSLSFFVCLESRNHHAIHACLKSSLVYFNMLYCMSNPIQLSSWVHIQ